MSTNTNPAGNVPLDTDTDVSLGTLLALVAEDVVREGDSTVLSNTYAPTEGRVAVLANDSVYIADGSTWVAASTIPLAADLTSRTPQDVRNISNPTAGDQAYHDGSGANTEGPAHYSTGDSWISDVDGSTIS